MLARSILPSARRAAFARNIIYSARAPGLFMSTTTSRDSGSVSPPIITESDFKNPDKLFDKYKKLRTNDPGNILRDEPHSQEELLMAMRELDAARRQVKREEKKSEDKDPTPLDADEVVTKPEAVEAMEERRGRWISHEDAEMYKHPG